MTTLIKSFHHSGRWDRSMPLLAAAVREDRKRGATVGTRTEMTTQRHHDVLTARNDGWEVYHPLTEHGYTNCSIEWDSREWEHLRDGVTPLTDIRIYTRKGYLLPPSVLPHVRLRHRETGRVVDWSSAHMQLANTLDRRAAWREEAATIRARTKRLMNRGIAVVFQGDVNRNQRLRIYRAKVRVELMAPDTHMLWATKMPNGGGTHGRRSLLDLTVSSMAGWSYLLPDDASSDHRPYGSTMRLQ